MIEVALDKKSQVQSKFLVIMSTTNKYVFTGEENLSTNCWKKARMVDALLLDAAPRHIISKPNYYIHY